VRVFGSVLHGGATDESDVDLLVSFEPDRSLFDMAGFVADVQELLGRKVDLADPERLHDLIRERVLAEAVPL